jgi:DNA repair exonuclease SbcCD nuclease subunit
MKIALITDTHAGARNDSVLFANFFRKFYENIFFPTLKERGITDVIHLGDMFDRRKFINYKTLNSWKKMFFDPLEEMGANIKIITGNHDSFYKNTLAVNSPQELTKGMDHVTVYSDPCEVSLTEDHKVLFLPWICDDNEDKSKELIEKTRTKVAFGHLQIAGIESDKGSFMMEGHSIAMFKAFQRVFSGHFHHRSITGNITYLGNPYEITWSDYNDKRGFHIYDTETMETEFIENPYSMFHKIYYNDEKNDYGDLSRYEDTYVKIIIENKNNNYMFETLMDKLVDAGTSNISVVDNLFDMEDLGDDIDGIEDVEDTMSVIKNCVNGLQMENKEDLNKLMQDLYSEALTMETV